VKHAAAEIKKAEAKGLRPRAPKVQRVSQMINQWDLNFMAKALPGRVDAPFVAAMGLPPLPTSTFHSGLSVNECWNASIATPAQSPLGTERYVVILFCPALTLLYGRG